MANKLHIYIYSAIVAVMLLVGAAPSQAQTWDFATLSDTDKANLNADTGAWTYDSANNRWKNNGTYDREPLMANGVELDFSRGLLLTAQAADRVRVDNKKGSLTLNGSGVTVIIPDLKAGTVVSVACQSSSSNTARGLTPTNLSITSGFEKSTDRGTHTGVVEADGDVTFTADGGIYVYSISANDGSEPDTPGTGGDTPQNGHSVLMNTTLNQARLTTTDNSVRYYNTADLGGIAIDRAAGTVTVTPLQGDWQDVYTKSVTNISFAKAADDGGNADISNGGVEITEARGWYESAYVKWNLTSEATSYNVYVKGGYYSDYTRIDAPLVRNYGTYGRADVVGLPAASGYSLKVVPVVGGSEDTSKASTADNITVAAYDRSGFAHLNYSGVGAYKDDGTLKDDARVIYVTAATAKTVTLDVVYTSKGATTDYTGLQAILTAYQKGYETRPLDIRVVGTIRDTDMDSFGSSAEGLQIKGKNNTIPMNVTMEGIGDDAAIWGFGILMRNAVSVELRNFAVMLCMDDCISIDTDNAHCWIHHIDLFYGQAGSASDQVKGDGTIDIKGDSQYITVAYNHLFDSGKSSLCGMTSETGPNYIDYHHNWFDHSDSRHPRVRTMTVHVWNNYYDGCAKYGVGATTGSSVFVESNYFRSTKNPMLSSKQGTDAKGDGTFSGEDGGMIKSYGNVYAEKGSSSNYTPITQKVSATSFDCYEAATRDEQVPSTYVTLVGGTKYNNFDTDPALIYSYTPLAAADVPATVTGYWGAGRLNKGDFKWSFDNATEDSNYNVITSLKTALENYKTTLVGVFGE